MTNQNPQTQASGKPAQAAGNKAMASNSQSKSNYESSYPDGASASTGLDKNAQSGQKEMGAPTHHQQNESGPTPPRDQIRPPEMDIAAQGNKTSGENIPDSVNKRSDGEEYTRHFSDQTTNKH